MVLIQTRLHFFKHVFAQIPDILQTNLLIAGDLNLVLDPYLERSSSHKAPPSNSSIFMKQYCNNSNLFDIWRIFNPRDRAYSFHSNVHNVYTRIDYYLADAKLVPLANKVVYNDIVISDHAPLSFSLNLANLPHCDRIWKLDPQLLKEPQFCNFLREQIYFFFEMNDLTGTSPSILWETMKAYIRGCIIYFQAARKRRKRAELADLEQQINRLDKKKCSASIHGDL